MRPGHRRVNTRESDFPEVVQMTLADRLRLLRGPMSYRAFADHIGWPLNTIRRYELGLARIPVEYVDVVCRAFAVSADWLLFGVEADNPGASDAPAPADPCAAGCPRTAKSPGKMLKREAERRYVLIDGEKVRLVRVPVLTRIPAGPAAEMTDTMPVGFGLEGEIWVPDPRDENAYGLVAWGDSMEPVIADGDTIVLSPRRALGFTNGLAVVRVPGGETCVKSIRRRPDRLLVESINPAYPRLEFSTGEAEVIATVIGVLKARGA